MGMLKLVWPCLIWLSTSAGAAAAAFMSVAPPAPDHMSPLRFLGPLVARRLPSRRLVHQSRNVANDVRRSGFSARRGSIVTTAITLSSALVGATLYFKQDTEQPTATGRKRPYLHTPICNCTPPAPTTLEDVIADEEDPAKEAALNAMFEEWMIDWQRWYESEREKAMRYREFKRYIKDTEKASARRLSRERARFGPNGLSNLTKEESCCRSGGDGDPPLYFKQDAEIPPAAAMRGSDLHTPALSRMTLEEVIAEEEEQAKEAALKAMFDEWTIEYERGYMGEEEKAMCYREFKRSVKFAEKANARRLRSGDAWYRPNCFAYSTEEEK